MKIALTTLLASFTLLHADEPTISWGPGDLNKKHNVKGPPVSTLKHFLDQRIGLSIHWGPSSLMGGEISWHRNNKNREQYDNLYKKFNPTEFDADQWCRHMKNWGLTYVAPTAKHHDGFALWFSKVSPYDMEATPFKRDIMKELGDACRRHGLGFGAYYSNLDWYHPDWTPNNHGGPGSLHPKYPDTPNMDRYIKFMTAQCKELIRDYGVQFIQFDGEWNDTWTREIGCKLYRDLRATSPTVLLSSRIDRGRTAAGKHNFNDIDFTKYAGDYHDRERVVNRGNNVIAWADYPWQAWVTLDSTQWSYKKNPKLHSADFIIRDCIHVLGNNGSYMINVPPMPSGAFPPEQVKIMDEFGAWIRPHSHALLATRGGPWYPVKDELYSTRRGNNAWLFLEKHPGKELLLPSLDVKVKAVNLYKGADKEGKPIPFKEENGLLTIQTGSLAKPAPFTVVQITFDGEATMSKTRKLPNKYELSGGKLVTGDFTLTLSSKDPQHHPKGNINDLLTKPVGEGAPYPVHTSQETRPHIQIDLRKQRNLYGIVIHNRTDGLHDRARNLALATSDDGKKWRTIWSAKGKAQAQWDIPLNTRKMGAPVPGQNHRYLRLFLDQPEKEYLHLHRIHIYEGPGKKE